MIRIGISGWTYDGWRGAFYPDGLPRAQELEYASRRLGSIEINGSFYSLQRPTSWIHWYEATPRDFVFSVKGSRYITHMRRLTEFETPLANFLASGILLLRQKLGPILWQFPPSFRFSSETVARLESFFELLPRDTREAARFAELHRSDWMARRSSTAIDRVRPIRHAMEVRHRSFEVPAFIELLRRFDVALVVADAASRWPFMEDMSSDFVYARLHGEKELYVSGYGPKALDRWAERIRIWSNGGQCPEPDRCVAPKMARPKRPRDVFVYFDNDVKARAPVDAIGLAKRLAILEGTGLRRAHAGRLAKRGAAK